MEAVLLPCVPDPLGVGGYREATPAELDRARREAGGRSQLVGVLAFVLLVAGLVLAPFTVLVPALFGLALLWSSTGLLSMRLNPFSPGFYIPTKPSWIAIGLVLICGILLVSDAWQLLRSGAAPLLPARWP